MECKVYDVNKLNTTSEEDKEYLKQTIIFHPAGAKCGQCGKEGSFLAHSCENSVWKHVCCDCVGARENWTQEKHMFEHQRALAVELIVALTAGASADAVGSAEVAEDTDDEMPELEDVNGNVAP